MGIRVKHKTERKNHAKIIGCKESWKKTFAMNVTDNR